MDLTSLIGPAVVAAGISGLVAGIGIWISASTARRIHSEKLAADRELAERKFVSDKELAEKRFSYDRDLAERKFAQEREQLVYRRRFELAEGLLADAYRFRGLVRDARMSGSFGEEGATRKSNEDESKQAKQERDMYYIPIERLQRDSEFFAGFFAKQFTAVAQFGPQAKESFDILIQAMNKVYIASGMLISMVERPSLNDRHVKEELFDDLWRGRAQALGREDKIDAEIERAVTTIEAICRPVLERTAS